MTSSDPIHWIEDYLHAVLGHSETTMEQFVIKLAQQKQMSSSQILQTELMDKLDLSSNNLNQTSELADKLFKHFQQDKVEASRKS